MLPNMREELFCIALTKGASQTDAAISAGFKPSSARRTGSRLMTYDHIKARLQELNGEIVQATVWDQAKLIDEAAKVVLANPSDLSEARRAPCRHCYGVDHLRQWRTLREYEAAHSRWRALPDGRRALEPEPSPEGGFGYTTKRDPNPDCPECDGDGILLTIIKATKDHPLFTAVEETRNGIKLVLKDQKAHLELIGRIIKAFSEPGDTNSAEAGAAFIDALTDIIKGSASKVPLNREGTLLAGQDKAQEAQEE